MSTATKEDDSNDEFESADEGEPVTPPPSKSQAPSRSPITKSPILLPETTESSNSLPITKSPSPPAIKKSPTPPPPPITKSPTPPPITTSSTPPRSSSPIIKSTSHSPSPPPLDSKPSSADENQVRSRSESPVITDGWDDWNIDDEQPIETPIKNIKSFKQDSISSHSSTPSKIEDSLSFVGSDEDDHDESSDQLRLSRKKCRKKPMELNLNQDTALSTKLSPSYERRHKELSLSASSPPTTTTENKHDVKDAHLILDQLSAQSPKSKSTWHNPWSNFGSLLSTAKQSVTTLTSTVSEGFSAVIESVEAGLGAPDPQKLAEMNQMAFKIKGETSDSEDEPELSTVQIENNDSVTNQDGWLNALSIEKLTTTGMKVVTGSLDVLETVGKKTFDVINEADPSLKGTRNLLRRQKQPTLSEIIREAKNETETKTVQPKTDATTFLQLFEKHQGLAHFEALELLSNQSSLTLQTMSHGNEKIIEQIDKYFQIDDDLDIDDTLDSSTIFDDNEKNHIPQLDALSQKFTAYQTQLRSTVSVDKLLEVYESANQFLTEWDWSDSELDQKTLFDEAIDCLAILCARIIEYYRKTAELFLIGCKSLTSFSIDIELLAIYEKQQKDFTNMLSGIPNLFAKYMKQASHTSSSGTDMPIRCDTKLKEKLLNQMFIQSSSSQTYASDAYALLKPIVTQSILYHTSTTR